LNFKYWQRERWKTGHGARMGEKKKNGFGIFRKCLYNGEKWNSRLFYFMP
jgi:hypothetical protein